MEIKARLRRVLNAQYSVHLPSVSRTLGATTVRYLYRSYVVALPHLSPPTRDPIKEKPNRILQSNENITGCQTFLDVP